MGEINLRHPIESAKALIGQRVGNPSVMSIGQGVDRTDVLILPTRASDKTRQPTCIAVTPSSEFIGIARGEEVTIGRNPGNKPNAITVPKNALTVSREQLSIKGNRVFDHGANKGHLTRVKPQSAESVASKRNGEWHAIPLSEQPQIQMAGGYELSFQKAEDGTLTVGVFDSGVTMMSREKRPTHHRKFADGEVVIIGSTHSFSPSEIYQPGRIGLRDVNGGERHKPILQNDTIVVMHKGVLYTYSQQKSQSQIISPSK